MSRDATMAKLQALNARKSGSANEAKPSAQKDEMAALHARIAALEAKLASHGDGQAQDVRAIRNELENRPSVTPSPS